MAFIIFSEIVAIIAMTFAIGYLFSDQLRRPVLASHEYDPLKYYSGKIGTLWDDILFAAMITAPPLVLHEFSHKIVAMSFGAEAILNAPYFMYAIIIVLKMMGFPLLFFVGGYVSHSYLPPLQSAIVSLAGPLMNFAIWYICKLLVDYKLVKKKHYTLIITMGRISLFLGGFNMIPIPGFDGFGFFSGLFKYFFP